MQECEEEEKEDEGQQSAKRCFRFGSGPSGPPQLHPLRPQWRSLTCFSSFSCRRILSVKSSSPRPCRAAPPPPLPLFKEQHSLSRSQQICRSSEVPSIHLETGSAEFGPGIRTPSGSAGGEEPCSFFTRVLKV